MSEKRLREKLSEKLAEWRADRPDEWKMDEFIRDAIRLERLAEEQLIDIGDFSVSLADNIGKNHMWLQKENGDGEGMSVDLDKLFKEWF